MKIKEVATEDSVLYRPSEIKEGEVFVHESNLKNIE